MFASAITAGGGEHALGPGLDECVGEFSGAAVEFNNYRPGEFLNQKVVAEVADTRRRRRRVVEDDSTKEG